jgi:hypothetical protein
MDRLLHLLSVGEGRLTKEEHLLGDADVAGLSESLTFGSRVAEERYEARAAHLPHRRAYA